MKNCFLSSFVLFMVFFTGCAGSDETRRGSLGDAMDKASDENKGRRKVQTEPAYPPPEPEVIVESGAVHYDISDATSNDREDNPTLAQDEKSSISPWLGLKIGGGSLKAKDFNSIGELGLTLGTYIDSHFYVELWGYLGGSSLTETSSLVKSVKDGVGFAGIGVEGKYFLTPSHTFLGPYGLAGISFFGMSWDYKNPIVADKYDDFGNVIGPETIYRDDLSGLDLFVGVGFHVAQFSWAQLGGEITSGVMLWSSTTGEGFDNDIFDPFTYVKLRFHLNIAI
ncbi:MAG: hypothetical protein HYY49_02540 [Ignavibacteriales bacterium]|nr:hypothetical protein [Ignavibacteriales bacterium]